MLFVYPPISLSVSPGPAAFVLDGVTSSVTEDTLTPANNKPMPSKMFIQKDGITYPVNKSTGTPSDTVAIPVEIVAASGTTINITAGDINIQTTDMGAGFDSMRIGDGSGNYIGVNANDEALVHDTDMLAKLEQVRLLEFSIDAKTPALGQALEAASTPVVLTALQMAALAPPAAITGFALASNQTDGSQKTQLVDAGGEIVDVKLLSVQLVATDRGIVTNSVIHGVTTGGGGGYVDVKVTPSGSLTTETTIVGTVPVSGPLTDTQLRATPVPVSGSVTANLGTVAGLALDTNVDALRVLTGDLTETAPLTDTASSGLNGRLQRIAQRITSLISLLPSSIGQKAAVDSLSIVPATDAVFSTTQAPPATIGSDESFNVDDSTGYLFVKPLGAVSMVIFNNADENGANRVRVGQSPDWATSIGAIISVGASTSLLSATSFTAIAENNTATANISVLWFY
jgi:hypothetical protein